MKKIVLSLLMCAAMASCKKENKNTAEVNTSQMDSALAPVSPEIAETVPFQQIEFNTSQLTDYLKPKENDTLYVTNFFATWCGPCMKEIPHFKEKMEELKNQPVKFTFISLDEKADWGSAVKKFSEENNLSKNIVLVDGSQLSPEFFSTHFTSWDGGSIPFTFIRKGSKTDETVGSMSKEMLSQKIDAIK